MAETMNSVTTGFSDQVRYTLGCAGYKSVFISEPIGWNEDEKEFARNEDYDGIFTKLSNSLRFYDDAADFLQIVYDALGVNAKPTLLKEIAHPVTSLWTQSYFGYLDMSTRSVENGIWSLQFNSGGLEQIFKARESDEIELDRETTLDGATIESLDADTKIMQNDGRKIFLMSRWEVYEENNSVSVRVLGVGPHTGATPIPFSLTTRSHEEAQDFSPATYMFDNETQVGALFFLESIEPRQLRIYGRLKFYVQHLDVDDDSEIYFIVKIRSYSPEPYYGLDDKAILLNVPLTPALVGQVYDLPFDYIIDIERGQSLAFEFFLGGVAVTTTTIRVSGIDCRLFVDEDSYFPPTKCKFLLVHDILQRQVLITTGKKENFYSEFFGRVEKGYAVNGNGAYVGATHGFWIRDFDRLPLSTRLAPNPFKPFTTSLRDTLDTLDVTHNIGMGIESNGFSERIRVEEKKYFYNPTVLIDLPDPITNITETTALRYCPSAIEIGYEKGGTYDEAMGLDEYNAKSNFMTCITGVVQKYVKIARWRADAYGKEFARRKPRFRFSTTDTNYDTDNFILDLKRLGVSAIFPELYAERKWQDDFSEEPEGVYDPASATNLRFSPFNLILIRHAWIISAGFTKFLNKYLMYGSSTANSRLKTKLRTDNDYRLDASATPGNGFSYQENGFDNGSKVIVNSELKIPRFVSEYIEFDHAVDFSIMQMIEGRTDIGGKMVDNKYGLVRFKKQNGQHGFGYLMSCKPNGAGRFKLLLANN